MNEKEIKDMIEPIPNWEFTYRYDCSRTCGKSYTQSLLDEKDKKIKDLQKKVEQLEKENKDLRRIYQNTYKKYLENGNEEMAHYFMAQIDACPTFYVEPIIDYYKEYHKLENIRKEAIEFINEWLFEAGGNGADMDYDTIVDLLNILNKGSDKE